jgi:hypothetical protein
VIPIDLAPYGIYLRGPLIVTSLGDVDGDSVDDFAVGTPWYQIVTFHNFNCKHTPFVVKELPIESLQFVDSGMMMEDYLIEEVFIYFS